MNSFRLRLALLVGLSTAALLLAAGMLAWELTTRFNVDRLDAEIHRLAKANLERVNDRSHWERLEVALGFVAGSDRPPPYVLWVKNHDRVEFRSNRWPPGLDPQSLTVPATYEGGLRFDHPPPPPRRAGISPENPGLPVRETASSTIAADGSSWRVAVTGNPYTVLVIAANLDQLNLDLVRLRHRYLVILPVILLLVGAAAWWLASRALQPVATLTAATERITAADLGQRIAAPGHDREFQRLVSVFNDMLDRLETGFHQARRFSADASHELKTPLARLQAELEHALDTAPPDSPSRQVYSGLLDEIQRLKAILEKLLLLALADGGRLALERTPTDLGGMLANIIEDSTALAPALRFESNLPQSIIAEVDPVLLEQALQNLAGNAIHYNQAGGAVRLSLTVENHHIAVTVANTGPGISAADRARVFDRFFRGDPARNRNRHGGVGLGLSLSREILRAHGGTLELAPTDGVWTTFVATLPLPALARAQPPN